MVWVKLDGSEDEPQPAMTDMTETMTRTLRFTLHILRKHFDRGSNCGFDRGSNVEDCFGELCVGVGRMPEEHRWFDQFQLVEQESSICSPEIIDSCVK